jgi:sugar fermentation stimulation protein A
VPKITDIEKGIYCLIIRCSSPASIHCSKFKDILFPAGYYYYIGSAQKNLNARLERHAGRKKRIHWHIDYLTTNKNFNVTEILIFKNKKKSYECFLSKDFLINFKPEIIAPGFGNSDCHKCESHLYYRKKKIPYNHFISLYQSIERFIPSSKETV